MPSIRQPATTKIILRPYPKLDIFVFLFDLGYELLFCYPCERRICSGEYKIKSLACVASMNWLWRV